MNERRHKAVFPGFKEMAEDHRWIGDVRGLGAMRAIELVKDRKSKEPAKDEVAAIIAEARAHGGLFLSAGWYGNVLRLLPPLNMAKEALAEGLDILEGAFTVVEKRAA